MPTAVNPLFNDPLLERFFGFQMPQQEPRMQTGAGSGVIVDADLGYILTNHHVVASADRVMVRLSDKREFDAEIIGSDEGTDIALLRIDATNLTALELGDSDSLEVGDFVLAIGNPFGLGQTVTSGIVSALGRSGLNVEGYEDFIQTDASINPGNSGGALIDLNGQLIGINSAIIAPAGGNVGIGFAVPTNMANEVVNQLLEFGEVRRGRLGIRIGDLEPALADAMGLDIDAGAVIGEVEPNSPAERAGLQPGDVIVEVDGTPIDGGLTLRNKIGLMRLGTTADIVVVRDGSRETLEATIGGEAERPTVSAGGRTIDKLQGAEFRTLDRRDPQFGQVMGVMVTAVAEASPAARRGLQAGDVITAVNRRPVRSAEDLEAEINNSTGVFALYLIRDNRRVFLPIQ
jgi:Do/DeqQ family serine protease